MSWDGPSQPQDIEWRQIKDTINLPIFPISITKDPATGKWQKKPLTQNGHRDANWNPGVFGPLWDRADGFGLPMGQVSSTFGLYAFDIDSYKDGGAAALDWMRANGVPGYRKGEEGQSGTRAHETVSGGIHLIFSLPAGHYNLPSRQNIAPGLDARGQGGWIAYGTGYRTLRDTAPWSLPAPVCEAVWAGYQGEARPIGSGIAGPAVSPEVAHLMASYREPPQREVEKTYVRLLGSSTTLRNRVAGRKSHGDASRSGIDFSVAHALLYRMVPEDVAVAILLHEVPNGQCSDPRMSPQMRLRAACRSVVKARAAVAAEEAARKAKDLPTQTLTTDAYLAALAASGDLE